MQLAISGKTFAGNFAYFKDGSTRPPVHQDPYVADLNGDGVDEVIFGGLETQPNLPSEFSPITVHIFGWKDGKFQDLSSQWLPNGAGDVMGVGSFEFADFNKDGRTDIFLAAYADMSDNFSPYVLYNRGNYFQKVALPNLEAWQHGSGSSDINQDGYPDVFATGYGAAPTIYLGGPNGLKQYTFTNFAGGSDVVLGDFLGDGSISAVISDYWQTGADTELVKVKINTANQTATVEELVTLPAPLLENPQTTNEESHDVRVTAVDFNADGLLDVVLYSRKWFDGYQWPNVSAVQLLQNQGKGEFVDVTADKLKGYVSASMIPYAPVIRDLNLDGLVDLYVDGASWNTAHNSASMLMQNSAGQFVDTARADLSRQVATNGGVSTVAMGPNGNFYLVTQDIQAGQGFISSQLLTFPDRQASENLRGTPLPDQIWGEGGNDSIQGLAGDDWINGGDGIDMAVYEASASQYTFTKVQEGCKVTSAVDGTDLLLNVERIQYADKYVAVDIDGNAGTTVKILGAVFGKSAVANKAYVGIGLSLIDQGMSYDALAGLALAAAKASTNDQIVATLWTNVVGSVPSSTDKAPFIKMLTEGMTPGALAHLAADTTLNASNINLVGLAQMGIEYVPLV